MVLHRYFDSVGVPTIGIGFNLLRGPGPLHAVGVPNPDAVIAGAVGITRQQALALLAHDLEDSVANARASLAPRIFDSMTDARRFVIVDFVYNMGFGTWISFANTRELINMAQQAKNAGNPNAHGYFVQAGNHIASSNYYQQVGNRAKRNVAMLVTGVWCDPNGDGYDVYKP